MPASAPRPDRTRPTTPPSAARRGRGGRRLAPLRVSTARLGVHQGNPRVWVTNLALLDAGFTPGRRLAVEFGTGRLVIRLSEAGDRQVAHRQRNGRAVPIIDIKCARLQQVFPGVDEVEVRVLEGVIEVTPARVAEKRLTRCRNRREGSLFSGGGLLTEAARQAGFRPAFAVERDAVHAETYAANHPGALVFNLSVENLRLDRLPPVELLTMGIPCEPFSRARVKARGSVPEAHPAGDMVFWGLLVVNHLNPATVVIEEAPAFLRSGAGAILQRALERMGYTVEGREVDPVAHGELTTRRRAVIVAHAGPIRWPAPRAAARTLAECLNAPDDPANQWFTRAEKPWLFRHWARNLAQGRNQQQRFLITAETQVVKTLTKRFDRGDQPVVLHPEDTADHPGARFRFLTVSEAARLMGLPAGYRLPVDRRRAEATVGQGVLVDFFADLIRHVAGGAPKAAGTPMADAAEGRQLVLL